MEISKSSEALYQVLRLQEKEVTNGLIVFKQVTGAMMYDHEPFVNHRLIDFKESGNKAIWRRTMIEVTQARIHFLTLWFRNDGNSWVPLLMAQMAEAAAAYLIHNADEWGSEQDNFVLELFNTAVFRSVKEELRNLGVLANDKTRLLEQPATLRLADYLRKTCRNGLKGLLKRFNGFLGGYPSEVLRAQEYTESGDATISFYNKSDKYSLLRFNYLEFFSVCYLNLFATGESKGYPAEYSLQAILFEFLTVEDYAIDIRTDDFTELMESATSRELLKYLTRSIAVLDSESRYHYEVINELFNY